MRKAFNKPLLSDLATHLIRIFPIESFSDSFGFLSPVFEIEVHSMQRNQYVKLSLNGQNVEYRFSKISFLPLDLDRGQGNYFWMNKFVQEPLEFRYVLHVYYAEETWHSKCENLRTRWLSTYNVISSSHVICKVGHYMTAGAETLC